MLFYAQSSGTYQCISTEEPIPGLSLELPVGSGERALVTLNVPAPYLTSGDEDSGYCVFSISVDGTTLPATAQFSGPVMVRVPTTLVVAVPLTSKPQQIVAQWGSFAAIANIDSPATFSALV